MEERGKGRRRGGEWEERVGERRRERRERGEVEGERGRKKSPFLSYFKP